MGAGFVGWGAYDFNKSRATSVAKVGDIDITMQKFQSGYSRLYSFYANNLGRDISDEEAQQMGLKEATLNSLIQESLLLNYASELGLSANDDEIIAELVATPSFQTNGAFDVKQYESVLKSLRTTPSAYEAELKDKLILSKLFRAFNLSANEIDTELIAANALLNDEISAKIITATRQTVARLPKTSLNSGSSAAGSKASIISLMDSTSRIASVASEAVSRSSVGVVLIIFPPEIC